MAPVPLWLSVPVALALSIVLLWLIRRWLLPPRERSFLTLRRPLARLIERSLGGYRQLVNPQDLDGAQDAHTPELSRRRAAGRRVAVIGAGLAGIGAAATLAERGYRVTLIEANHYIGGKIGAWEVRQGDQVLPVEHGFHAFFRHYYNLNGFLSRLGILQNFSLIDDYVIIDRSGQRLGFAAAEPTPVLNLVALERAGLYHFGEIARSRAIDRMDAFLTYDSERTFAELDHVSYREFADDAELPAGLRKVFTTFSRAFFADDDKLSMAQLIKSFHFYYLSHDHGLLYEYPAEDYRPAVLAPIEAHLRAHGVVVKLGRPTLCIDRVQGSYRIVDAAGSGAEPDEPLELFDDVVLATPAVVARKLLEASPSLAAEVPDLLGRLQSLPRGQRYAVLRLWLDKPIAGDLPVFVSTERAPALDAVAIYERITPWARKWAAEHGGSVLELHCYAVPDDMDDTAVPAALVAEMEQHFEELRGATVLNQVLQIRDDFTAFHRGTARRRPTTRCELDSFVVAGDWVALPIPAMLMEAAFSSGLYAANALLERDGLQPTSIYSVPRRGILAPLEDFKRRHQRPRGHVATPKPAGAQVRGVASS